MTSYQEFLKNQEYISYKNQLQEINFDTKLRYLAKKYNDHTFVIPVHPNPNVKNKIHEHLSKYTNIHLLKPLV